MKFTSSGLIILLALLIAQTGQADSNWILWEKFEHTSFYKNGETFSWPVEWHAREETASLVECSPLISKYIALQENHLRKLGYTIIKGGNQLLGGSKPNQYGQSFTANSSYYCYPFGLDPRKK